MDIAVCAMLGAIMFCSKIFLEFLPNIHLLAMFILVFTVVYRAKALIAIYVFVAITGVYAGFALWWIPYLYIWTVLWAAVMLLPKNMPKKIAVPVYIIVCALHGLLYGILYSPFQAVAFGLDLKGTISWIIAGLPYDLIHGVGNAVSATLALPLITAIKKVTKR